MGTSDSFKGSGGKDARDLRDAIADWLGDTAPSDSTPTVDSTPVPVGSPANPISPSLIGPVINMWRGSSGGSGGGGGAGGGSSSGDGTRSAGGGRSSGGVQRTVARVAGPAGRASSLARAYSTGNREALEVAGLNYDDLRALNDPLEIGQRIVEAAFDAQSDSTLEDSESRLIVAELISWILESPADQEPAPDEIVRHSIELMIAQLLLTEVGNMIRQKKSQTERHEDEEEIRRAAQVWASQLTLGDVGTSSNEIATAIENGFTQLKEIYEAAE